jgi:hypothetical protein
MNATQTQPFSDSLESSPSGDTPQIVRLKVPDGFKPSTVVENTVAAAPMKPPRIAFPFEEIR